MGNAEKFKPTQPGANNSFVEPALLSRHDELTWLFHRVRPKSACFAMQGGVSQRSVFTGRKGQHGARGQRHWFTERDGQQEYRARLQRWLSRGLLVCFTVPQFALLGNGSGAAELFHRALLEPGAEPVSVVGGRDGAAVSLVLFWHHLGTLPNTCENGEEKEQLWGQCSSAVEVLRAASSRCLAEEFLFSPSVGSLAEMLLPWDTLLSWQLPGEQGLAGSVLCAV